LKDARIARLARTLVEFSLALKQKQTVSISAQPVASPLVNEVYRCALRAGCYAHVRIATDELAEIFYSEATPHQLAHTSPLALYEARKTDASVRILSSSNTQAMVGVDPKKQAVTSHARRPILDEILKRTWVLTLYPTQAFAQDAQMSLASFEDFVYRACFCHKRDPVAEWRKLKKMQAGLVRRLNRAKKVRIVGPDTDLTLSVAGRTFINSYGTNNMPSGEVFTGPVEDSAEGQIRYTFPVSAYGRTAEDVCLVFKKGKVAGATAAKGQDFVRTMIKMDPGASRLGELGIGTNFAIKQFIKNILFDEKIGGTIHLALGRSYPETGGRNHSALHWDMIKDLRTDGRLEVDGTVLMENGRFHID